MVRRTTAALAAVTLLACSGGGGAEPAAPRGDVLLPRVMAALGDSMTRAFVLCDDVGDCPEASWSTGTEVDSHRRRLERLGAKVEAWNVAVSGATVSGLEAQARRAVATRAEYVTVLVGANDACRPTESAMTPVDAFARAFDRGLATLVEGLPSARVLVVSIPDLMRLWEVGRGDPGTVATWTRYGVCRSMLAAPGSEAPADVARRRRVRARVEAYNAAMAAACAKHATCRWDGGAVFRDRFGLDSVSERDRWHPSREGQRRLSEVSWNAGWYGGQPTAQRT